MDHVLNGDVFSAEDVVLIQQLTAKMRDTSDVKRALGEQVEIEMALASLTATAQVAWQAADRAARSAEAAELDALFVGSNLAVDKAKARVGADQKVAGLKACAGRFEAGLDFLRNLQWVARDRMRVLEHLANYERLEQRIDDRSTQ